MELKKGSVVISLKGRDKNRLMCVVEVNKNGVYVCDGKERKLVNPKLKNPKHIMFTEMVLSDAQMHSDRSVRKALNLIPEANLCQNKI